MPLENALRPAITVLVEDAREWRARQITGSVSYWAALRRADRDYVRGRIGRRNRLQLDRRRRAAGCIVQSRIYSATCPSGRRIETLDLGDPVLAMGVDHDHAGVNR
jgi:hypothetical protein